jgi:hypothetical protein
MADDEVAEILRNHSALDVTAGLDFCRYVPRDVIRPMLKHVECYDPDVIVELAGQEIGDDGVEVGSFDLGLAVNAAAAEAVDHEIDGLIRAIGHDPWHPVGPVMTHASQRNRNPAGLNLSPANWFLLRAEGPSLANAAAGETSAASLSMTNWRTRWARSRSPEGHPHVVHLAHFNRKSPGQRPVMEMRQTTGKNGYPLRRGTE